MTDAPQQPAETTEGSDGLLSGERIVFRAPSRDYSLGPSYFDQALQALRDSGSSDALWPAEYRAFTDDDRDPLLGVALLSAAEKRDRHVRTTIVFSAFASEAYVNEFIAAHFSGEDRRTVDRLPTYEKYVIAPRLALGRELFSRGEEPWQSLRKLFRLRDSLVHPKPRSEPPDRSDLRVDPTFNAAVASAVLVAAGKAANVLVKEGPLGDGFDFMTHLIVQEGSSLREFGNALVSQRLPMPNAPALPESLLSGIQSGEIVLATAEGKQSA